VVDVPAGEKMMMTVVAAVVARLHVAAAVAIMMMTAGLHVVVAVAVAGNSFLITETVCR
jgi:hypothetical protein